MARGVAFGRPSKLREDQKDAVRDLVKNGRSISVVARTFNVHPATIYRCLDENRPYGPSPFLSALDPKISSRPEDPSHRLRNILE